jgi:hypothetical protein
MPYVAACGPPPCWMLLPVQGGYGRLYDVHRDGVTEAFAPLGVTHSFSPTIRETLEASHSIGVKRRICVPARNGGSTLYRPFVRETW